MTRGLNTPEAPFSLTCSGDEERVCFVPSEVISPPFPLSNNPWVESIITEITDLGGESSQRPVIKEASGSSASSESHSLGLRLSEHVVEHEVGNGSSNPHLQQGRTEEAAEENRQEEYQCRELKLVSGWYTSSRWI